MSRRLSQWRYLMKLLDLTGQKFDRLTAVERAETKNGRTQWHCVCKCGSKYVVGTSSLRTGNAKSCGCLKLKRRHYLLPFGEAAFNTVYAKYKTSARSRNLEFSLSKEIFRDMVGRNCYFCDVAPSNIETCGNRTNGHFVYSGIDRLDPGKGYIIGNCVPCCKPCNYAKHSRTYEEFMSWVRKVYLNLYGFEEAR